MDEKQATGTPSNEVEMPFGNDDGSFEIKCDRPYLEGEEYFYNELDKMFHLNKITADNEIMITNIRHKKIIEKAIEHVKGAKKDLAEGMPIDIISINIKSALEDLAEITGENVTEDIIKDIFSKFCLGK